MNLRILKVGFEHRVGAQPLSRWIARCALFAALVFAVYLAQSDAVHAQAPDDASRNATESAAQSGASPRVARPSNESSAGELEGEEELRWILARLGLTDTQQSDASALLETYRYRTGEGADVTHLNELLTAYQAAEEASDQARMAEIKAELTDARPDVKARREFLVALQAMLTPDQQLQLTAIESFLRNFPSGRVTPLHIYKLARALGLSAKQLRELDEVHTQFRTRRIPQLGAPAQIPLSGIEDEFAQAVRQILTSEQQVAFDSELAATQLRVEREHQLGKGGTPQ